MSFQFNYGFGPQHQTMLDFIMPGVSDIFNTYRSTGRVDEDSMGRFFPQFFTQPDRFSQLFADFDSHNNNGHIPQHIIDQMFGMYQDPGPPPNPKDFVDQVLGRETCLDQLHLKTSPSCAICFDDFHVGDRGVPLSCTHVFHRDCIGPWLDNHDTCPVCRQRIRVDIRRAPNSQSRTRASTSSTSTSSGSSWGRPSSTTNGGSGGYSTSSSSSRPTTRPQAPPPRHRSPPPTVSSSSSSTSPSFTSQLGQFANSMASRLTNLFTPSSSTSPPGGGPGPRSHSAHARTPTSNPRATNPTTSAFAPSSSSTASTSASRHRPYPADRPSTANSTASARTTTTTTSSSQFPRNSTRGTGGSGAGQGAGAVPPKDPATMTVYELKFYLDREGVDYTGVCEKHELVSLLRQAYQRRGL